MVAAGTPILNVHADEARWVAAAVAGIVAGLQADLHARGQARLLLSGGGTPAPVYRALAGEALDWGRITVALVDERWLPGDPPHRNDFLVRETLLAGPAASARFEPMVEPGANLDQGVARANARSAASSVVVLGMGPDGHTASLFPGMRDLGVVLAQPLHYAAVDATGCPGAQGWNLRISLTPAGMAASARRLLLLRGQEKLDLLQRALAGDDVGELPVRAAMRLPGPALQVHWYP